MIDLTDAIDLHVHTAPDVYPRSVTDHELVREAAAAGMRALLLKSHHTLTADRATLARPEVGIEVFGGLALNQTVGGLNPVAVETAIEFGARQIWMPTIHAAHCMQVAEGEMFQAEARRGRAGIRVVDDAGRVTREALLIVEIVRDAGIILGTGHLAPSESLALLAAAADMGCDRLLVTHPNMAFTRFTHKQMRQAAGYGATLEFDYLSCSPKWPGAIDPAQTAAAIRAVGARHCVMATDGGQPYNPHPPQMLRAFAAAMLEQGIAAADLRTMMCDNPARLLGLGG